MDAHRTQTDQGMRFRDLNKNGRLDPYEDPSQPIAARVADLLGQMTLEEKAGMLFHTMAPPDPSRRPFSGQVPTATLITESLMNHFNVAGGAPPRRLAEWHNDLQRLAEQTRLGIPITFSSDPRHSFSDNPLTSINAGSFSLWPEPIGLAAIGDAALVERFGDIARQEYLAVGIRVALHPMVDLATEPRWGRINGTFGEDATLTAILGAAYIRGFQGEKLGPHSVACMTKHFPGGGPQKDGEDPHFSYGREQVYPGNNFDYHLIPFEAAIAAGTSQIMPYYGMPIGTGLEEVGFAFSKEVITAMLRQRYAFDGIVCTDWGLLTDSPVGVARAWGVEHLSIAERAKKLLDAGVDQFGGERCVEVIIGLVRDGHVPEARIDESVGRLLREKFRLGLFDAPYVDPDSAEQTVGKAEFRVLGERAQRQSIVLLKNSAVQNRPMLPLVGKPKLYVEGIQADAAQAVGEVVAAPDQADVAVIRLKTPYEPRAGFLQRLIHAGDLNFSADDEARVRRICAQAPTIICVYMDRPAVLPELAADCAALLADFGASDAALLDIVFGRFAPVGKLSFELPSSMEAVRKQLPDVPFDSERPLFPFGHGLTYEHTP